jgi:hypothetical protein
MIDIDLIKKTLIYDVKDIDLNDSIVTFQNQKQGIIDGQLTSACHNAIKELMPKTAHTIPISAMESSVMSFGRYKRLKEYAKEQMAMSQSTLGVLYIYPDDKSMEMSACIALNETVRLLDDQQKQHSAVYCSDTVSTNSKKDVSQWCTDNNIYYTEDIKSAYKRWSTGV